MITSAYYKIEKSKQKQKSALENFTRQSSYHNNAPAHSSHQTMAIFGEFLTGDYQTSMLSFLCASFWLIKGHPFFPSVSDVQDCMTMAKSLGLSIL